MSTKPYYQPVPEAPQQWSPAWAQVVQTMVNVLLRKLNCTADLTLRAGQATTIMQDPRLSAFSVLTFMPTTASAATAKASVYVTAQNNGVATINHANTADTDKTFKVALHG